MNAKRAESILQFKDTSTVVAAIEKGENCKEEADIFCTLGEDIKFFYERLQKYYWSKLSELDVDLLTLVGLVVFADRSVRRGNKRWARRLVIKLPVHRPDVWSDEELNFNLVDCLRFLTGDAWSFEFTQRRSRDEVLSYNFLVNRPLGHEVIVMPYSGGLDSFAELNRFRSENRDSTLVPVGAAHRSSLGPLLKRTPELRGIGPLTVPVRIPVPMHAEQSFRSRTFLFFVLASVAAKLAQAKYVLIPENGQGSLGPSLMPWGDEHPFQTSHPGFTLRLRKFLAMLWGGRFVSFRHPNIWKTKSEVMRQVSSIISPDDWMSTVSCGFDPRRSKSAPSGPAHCGICGGCILRRMSLIAAGLSDVHEQEAYLWKDLRAESLDQSMLRPLPPRVKPTSLGDLNMATCSVLDQQKLAQMADATDSSILKRAAFEAGNGIGVSCEESSRRLIDLLSHHRDDWSIFLDVLGPRSWVARMAEVGI